MGSEKQHNRKNPEGMKPSGFFLLGNIDYMA
jgi:hypothetical protein